jgi:hypothetical protein
MYVGVPGLQGTDISSLWVLYKVNHCELLHIPSENCYHACNFEDGENYGIIQEDDLLSSFNVEIGTGLDSLVRDSYNVDIVVKKRKRASAQKKKMKWYPWDKETT